MSTMQRNQPPTVYVDDDDRFVGLVGPNNELTNFVIVRVAVNREGEGEGESDELEDSFSDLGDNGMASQYANTLLSNNTKSTYQVGDLVDLQANSAGEILASDKKLKMGRESSGNLVATFIFLFGKRIWVVSQDEMPSDKGTVWQFPSLEVRDASLSPENVQSEDLMISFIESLDMSVAPSLKGPDAFRIVKIGKKHVAYIAEVEAFEELPSQPGIYSQGTWVSWESLKPAMRYFNVSKQKLKFKKKTGMTLRKLSRKGYVDNGITLESNESKKKKLPGLFSGANRYYVDVGGDVQRSIMYGEEEYEQPGELDDEAVAFSYYSIRAGQFIQHDVDDEHIFFSGQTPRSGLRSPQRMSSLDTSEGHMGMKSSVYGDDWYSYGNAVPYRPDVPVKYLRFRNEFYPRAYLHTRPQMTEAGRLPSLPSFRKGASGSAINLQLAELRTKYPRWFGMGYDIVPNFYTSSFDWVRVIDQSM